MVQEIPIRLAGRDYKMRTGWRVNIAIEEQAGSIMALARDASAGSIGFRNAAYVITEGLKAGGEPAQFDKVSELIFEEGLLAVRVALCEFLMASINGGKPLTDEEDDGDGA